MNSANISKQPLLGPDRYISLIFRVLICSALALNVTQQALAFSPLPPSDGPLTTSITISSPGNTLARPGESLQLTVTATLSDDTVEDITSSETGIEY